MSILQTEKHYLPVITRRINDEDTLWFLRFVCAKHTEGGLCVYIRIVCDSLIFVLTSLILGKLTTILRQYSIMALTLIHIR